jgi:hypothetical protein
MAVRIDDDPSPRNSLPSTAGGRRSNVSATARRIPSKASVICRRPATSFLGQFSRPAVVVIRTFIEEPGRRGSPGPRPKAPLLKSL